MARVEANWERLVRAALRGERMGGGYGVPASGIAGNVPTSLGNNTHIDEVLRAADEIQDEDPTVARILFLNQKLAKREGGAIDRSQDIAKLQEFYKLYREKHKVDELCEDEMKLRESAVFSGNLGELERKTLKRKKVLATLKVLWSVIEDITREISPEDADKLISPEMKKVMQKDAARTEDVVAYNIIPLDALSTTNAIVTFPEVRAAISALQYHRDLPRLPGNISVPDARNSDMLDLLHCVFGFQKGNVSNQREHIVHLLANEQSRLGKLSGNEPLARELEETMRKQIAEPAESCISNDGVSFLDQVISPLYEIIAAEAANNNNGRAAHSAWRNYDDFNEFFWSLKCFQLGWPWKLSSPFFSKPTRKEIRSVEAVHRFFEKFPEAFMDKLHVPVPKRKQLLSSGQVFLAKDIAVDCKDSQDSQDELWLRISKDEYMQYAVEECFHTIYHILTSILDKEGHLWVQRIYGGIRESISKKNIQSDIHFSKLPNVIAKLVAVAGILKEAESADMKKGAVNAIQDLYEVVHHEVLSVDMSGNIDDWSQINRARAEGRLFSNLKWPNDPGLKDLIKRLHSLLTIKESAANVPKNLEACRRLEFFTNSLFMRMPLARPVSEMLSFSVFTPYYSETVLYSIAELQKRNEDGISTLFYLQKIYPDEWKNFLTRINRDENAAESELFSSANDILELRLWASYRGQTLARTVRGMMYYRKALMLQSYLERMHSEDLESAFDMAGLADTHFEYSPEARAQADLKFTYVVTCQIYGLQKGEGKQEAADIALLMQRNEALRIAYIDVVESIKNGKPSTEYYSKLVKADIHGKDKDNYFEEALKMRNLLEEFSQDHGKFKPSILGVREHVFTGSVSSLASFMSSQETSFVTLGQRVLSNPLKVRMHYGHPDVFDRIFHITRGGISKASRIINISEDIFAGKTRELLLLRLVLIGFNSTLRQGNITHHEYIQVGKGRDVGLNQIALFEGKVAGGNGEQVLSRDIYRLGQLFDFFRMLSFYVTTIGFYFCTMLTVLTVYIFLYGKTYLALSGVGESIQNRADIMQNKALTVALNTQFLFQIGVFTAIPMILGLILEAGVLTVYWVSWAVLGGLFVLLMVFSLNPKAMVHFQLLLRLVKSIALLVVLAGLIVAIVSTRLSFTDVLASILAYVPTGWGILSIAVAWKPIVKRLEFSDLAASFRAEI
ncbi:hypothetical protein ACQ4PT_003651 [Festuca glaucescens]